MIEQLHLGDPAQPPYLHNLDVGALWRCIGGDDVGESGKDESILNENGFRRTRKPSLTNAIRAAKAAGMTVSGATIAPDGSVVLTFGDGSTSSDNPWDKVLRRAPH